MKWTFYTQNPWKSRILWKLGGSSDEHSYRSSGACCFQAVQGTHTHNFNRVGMRRWLVVIVHPCMTTWQYAYTTVSSVVQLLVMSHWTVVLIKCPVHLCSGYCHGIAMPKKMNYLQNKAIFTHNSNALWCTQLRLTALCSTYGWL